MGTRFNPHAPDWHKPADIPPDITLREYADAWLDMAPHIDQLTRYAYECQTIVEFGVRGGVSTWALLDGMLKDGRYIGVDIDPDPPLPPAVRDDPRFMLVVGEAATVKLPVKRADLVMIDASHEFAPTVAELVRAASLQPDVILCHDYYYRHTPQVRLAVDGYVAPGYLRDEPYRLVNVYKSEWGLAVLAPR
jgi:cephalosporin hydroxylase